jgi:Fe-S cluster biogenesis protein NfuA
MPVRTETLHARLAEIERYTSTHAGGVRLKDVSDDGHVRLEFTGMCTGCPFRAVTMAATIRPALLEIEGVTRVEAIGSRISEQAEERLGSLLADGRTGIPAWITTSPRRETAHRRNARSAPGGTRDDSCS